MKRSIPTIPLLQQRRPRLSALALLLSLLTLCGGCDLMHDDLAPCATDPAVTTVVNFVYDYNTSGTDLFDREVGSVYLYVFSEDSVFLGRYARHRSDLDASNPDFSMTFDSSVIEMGKTYHFVAVAQGSHEGRVLTEEDDDDTNNPFGFRLVKPLVVGWSHLSDYILRLYREDKMVEGKDYGVVDYTEDYSGPDAMIDTVWTTKPDEVQTHTIPYLKAEFDSPDQQPDHVEEVVIPMMRITNSIVVALTGPGFTSSTQPTDYDIVIYFPEGNGTIDFVGETLTEISQPLYYRALRKRVDVYEDHEGTRVGEDEGEDAAGDAEGGDDADADAASRQYAIYATFGVSRLKYDDGAVLQVRDPVTHEILAQIENFSQYLNDSGNTDYDDPQEYLDREFDFRVNVGLDHDGRLWWSQVGIGIHDWAVKDWYVDL